LILCEGLLIYFSREQVGALADDLAARATFRAWTIDIASPGLLAMLEKRVGDRLQHAGAPFKFAPPEGPAFFDAHGWRVAEVRSVLKAAAQINRLSFFMRMMARLPEKQPPGSRPWSAVCLLTR
jgi:O-methyltransferase involved in polyketide biosynthesis